MTQPNDTADAYQSGLSQRLALQGTYGQANVVTAARPITFLEQDRTRLGIAAATEDLDAVDEAYEQQPLNERGHVQSDRLLDQFQETPLHLAASQGRLDTCRYLIKELEMHVDPVNFEGWTPLCHALVSGHIDVAKFLLKSGARADHVTSTGNTVLHLAAWHGTAVSVTWLLQHGMQHDLPNRHGCCPFDMAPAGPVRQMLYDSQQTALRKRGA